ncbi:hypothetical protein E8K88_14760 [Lampropedia aestuarii]|uniref:Uncharacterized protein n=1 Tax=Lampropedia aestuarii TaxID=2562762 RepID=A0A4S5BLG8_9BURK|nr:hypothetical protein [Lampropedia aestuarii]THJ31571.1 hypothetical protein E8K88_14760 [Lampropedia aestuarii]
MDFQCSDKQLGLPRQLRTLLDHGVLALNQPWQDLAHRSECPSAVIELLKHPTKGRLGTNADYCFNPLAHHQAARCATHHGFKPADSNHRSNTFKDTP